MKEFIKNHQKLMSVLGLVGLGAVIAGIAWLVNPEDVASTVTE